MLIHDIGIIPCHRIRIKGDKIMAKVLIIGASGRVGSQLIKAFDKNSDGVELVLGTSREETAQKWQEEGREAVVLDLNKPEGFEAALAGIDRVFLLTGYTSDMLYQSKLFVDAAKNAKVSHIVHLGVFTSRQDPIPHFVWHDLIETYIAASGIAWTNIHPNIITDSVLDVNPPMSETNSFMSFCGDVPQGWVCTADIADVAATVLREGPAKHAGKNYYLSIEVLTVTEVANILSEASGKKIKCNYIDKDQQEAMFAQIPSVPVQTYMESAVITMELTRNRKFKAQTELQDDVLTVVGRPGTTMKEWANNYFKYKI